MIMKKQANDEDNGVKEPKEVPDDVVTIPTRQLSKKSPDPVKFKI